ncbi:hypothetical protein ANN_22769 [Periplaneta americana]|uniref:Uncharacterized protein n=1 Tax=Periplaneta americana TaxID=6978 RepID=A0ABQ8SK92_PERAM|nr:hypothetical protein ANN_22769 [Periplaneta americana]
MRIRCDKIVSPILQLIVGFDWLKLNRLLRSIRTLVPRLKKSTPERTSRVSTSNSFAIRPPAALHDEGCLRPPWPPRSPDLTPLDFSLWGRMKSLVYETPVETAAYLVVRVVVAAGEIADTPGVIERVYQNIIRRYNACNEVCEGGETYKGFSSIKFITLTGRRRAECVVAPERVRGAHRSNYGKKNSEFPVLELTPRQQMSINLRESAAG